MKLRALINGLTALLAVGMVCAFSVCIDQDVSEDSISEKYAYSIEDESKNENEDELPEEGYVESEEAEVSETAAASAGVEAFIPGSIVLPKAAPNSVDMTFDEDTEEADEEEEVTDDEYRENSFIYSGYSEDELDRIFSEEENVNEYVSATAEISDGSSRYSGKSSKAVDSGNITADDINTRTVEDAAKEHNDRLIAEADIPAMDNSGYVDQSLIDLLDSGCGEVLTAKVHGEVTDFDAYDLTCMIVANEMSPSFCMEALKAQALAAYSYVRYHNDRGLTPSVLVKEDVANEIKYAVAAVWGKCCYYNGKSAQTMYTASTSGFTASAENVWGGDPVPYLSSRECYIDLEGDPNYGYEKVYSESEIRNKLEGYLGIRLSDSPKKWLRITEYVDGNYVSKIDVDGQEVISGPELREKVLSYGLKSAAFTVSYSGGEFLFTTYGYGHGVGMSQNGANILASRGYTYKEILEYYFEGITVE